MRDADFASLRETLLREGVARKHVRRAIAELRDHQTDLFSESFANGRSVEDAEREASIRLGSEDALAAAILARPELKSWMHRRPRIAYWLIPTMLFFPAFAVMILLLRLSGAPHADYETFLRRWGSPHSARSLAGAVRLFYNVGLPLVLAGACCVVAGRSRAAMKWPVIGVLTTSFIGGAIQWDLLWPHGPDGHGAISLTVAVLPFPGLGGTLVRAATTCALTLGPLLWWTIKRISSRRLS